MPRTRRFPLLLLTCCAMSTPVRLTAADVDTYRGIDGSGTYAESGLLRSWPEGGPKRLWTAATGHGWAGPAVIGNRVFIAGGHDCQLFTYDLEDGRLLDQAMVGSAAWKRWTGTRTVPLIAGGVAVVGLPDAKLVGIDLSTRQQKWEVNAWKSFGSGKGHQGWGWTETPARHGNLLFFNTCSRDLETPPLMAMDPITGKTVWQMAQHPKEDGAAKRYSAGDVSGVVFLHRGRALLAYPTWRYLMVLDATTGQLLWEIPSEGDHTLPPIYVPDRGWLLANLIPPGRKDQALTCLELSPDGSSYTVRWRRLGAVQAWSYAAATKDHVCTLGRPDGAVLDGEGKELIPAPAADPKAKGRSSSAMLLLDLPTGQLLAQTDAHLNEGGHVVAAEGLFYVQDHAVTAPNEPNKPERQTEAQALARLAPVRLRLIQPTAEGLQVMGTLIQPIRTHEDLGGSSAMDVAWYAAIAPVIAHGRLFVRYGGLHVFDLRPTMGVRQGD